MFTLPGNEMNRFRHKGRLGRNETGHAETVTITFMDNNALLFHL